MNSPKFISFCIMLWYSNYAVKVQAEKQKALIFNQETKQLLELNVDHDSAKCTYCIAACPLSTEIIRKATISGNGLLVQKVYDDAENPTKIETDICDQPMTPSIVYDPTPENFEIGYEMFYRKGQLINLNCNLYPYNELLNIIDGKPNREGRGFINDQSITKIDEDDNTTFRINGKPHETTTTVGEPNQEDRQPINDKSITTTINDDPNTTFQIEDNPDETMVFYWIPVLTLDNFADPNRRHITIEKDAINDYFHKERVISHCENYYLSVGDQIVPLERGCQIPTSKCEKVFNWIFSKKPAADKRLEKTQIVPMHMLHTLPGRLATCMYANIAFIWSSIANGQLQDVDLFLYALYKLHPSNINIYFGVKGELKDISPELTASENPTFHKYSIPEFMYRIVEWTNGKVVRKVIVVIHNDPKSIKEDDRICSTSDQVPDWNDIKSSDTTTITGTSYTCPHSGQNTLSKMGLHTDFSWESFSIKRFPTTGDSDRRIIYKDISDQVLAEFNWLKSLKN